MNTASPKLLAFAASHRSASYNLQLLTLAIAQAKASGADVTLLDYASLDAPLFKDTDAPQSTPAAMTKLADALLAHDGLLLAAPEYNWSMPASLKNIIDWLSTDKRAPFSSKTCLLLAATPSSRGALSGLKQLRTPLLNLNMWVYPQLIGIGSCTTAMDANGLTHAKDRDFMHTHVGAFVAATRKLAAN